MTVYKLLWQLFVHTLCGRGKDDVFICVYVPEYADRRDIARTHVAVGEKVDFTWESKEDAFCTLVADHVRFREQKPNGGEDKVDLSVVK